VLRVEEKKCADGGRDTESYIETCVQNVPSCGDLLKSAFNKTDNTLECVTTVTFQLSKYNENLKPFAGTCADYEKYFNNQISCLPAETGCSSGAPGGGTPGGGTPGGGSPPGGSPPG
jgi:hypothetical protein